MADGKPKRGLACPALGCPEPAERDAARRRVYLQHPRRNILRQQEDAAPEMSPGGGIAQYSQGPYPAFIQGAISEIVLANRFLYLNIS